MNARHIDGVRSIDDIDRDMTAQIRAYVRRERLESAAWWIVSLGSLVAAMTLAWWMK